MINAVSGLTEKYYVGVCLIVKPSRPKDIAKPGLPAIIESKSMNNPFFDANALDRRRFLQISGAVLGAAGLMGVSKAAAVGATEAWPPAAHTLIRKNEIILFQGDSITDAGRSRDKSHVANEQPGMGSGYAWLAGAELLVDRPHDGLRVFNRGISGNKVFQLAERWQTDCLDLKPTLLSILIGVNDIWHKLNGKYDGTVQVYERDYRALLERIRKALPKVKLVICEPFVLRAGA